MSDDEEIVFPDEECDENAAIAQCDDDDEKEEDWETEDSEENGGIEYTFEEVDSKVGDRNYYKSLMKKKISTRITKADIRKFKNVQIVKPITRFSTDFTDELRNYVREELRLESAEEKIHKACNHNIGAYLSSVYNTIYYNRNVQLTAPMEGGTINSPGATNEPFIDTLGSDLFATERDQNILNMQLLLEKPIIQEGEQCSKCGSKSTVKTIAQLRGGDEQANIFTKCLQCGYQRKT